MFNRPFIRNLLLTLALVLVGTTLYMWTPERFNLLAKLLVRFAILSLGSAVLVEALARKWLRPTGPALLGALAAWLLLPLLAAPLAKAWSLDRLMDYYHSAVFRRVNSPWHGVRVELQDQQFTFAEAQPRRLQDGPVYPASELYPAGLRRCTIGGYTATYRIDAERDQQLTFALSSPASDQFSSDKNMAAQSIQAAFAQIGPGHAEEAIWQGLFHVPRGSHKLVVRSDQPFLLEVYGTDPLWTPDLVLSGSRRYAPLYADVFSRAEFAAAARTALPATCAPVGCPDDPNGLPGITIPPTIPDSAAIHNVVDEHAVDSDGDGLYNQLDLVVVVDIKRTGYYVLDAILAGPDGHGLLQSTYTSADDEMLCQGEHMIKLSFPGSELARMEVDGPYTLRTLQLKWQERDGYDSEKEVDYVRDAHTTAPYLAQEFQASWR